MLKVKGLHWWITTRQTSDRIDNRSVECFIDTDHGMFMGVGDNKYTALQKAINGIYEWKNAVKE